MDIHQRTSGSSARPHPSFSTSFSVTISPSTSPKSRQLRMRRTMSASQATSASTTSHSSDLTLDHDNVYSSVHGHATIQVMPKRPVESPRTSTLTQWSASQGICATDEDDYAWYYRNPHRYIRRPRSRALRCNPSNPSATATTGQYSYNGNGDATGCGLRGGEANMRLFAAYLGRHYAATPLSTAFNLKSSEATPPTPLSINTSLPEDDGIASSVEGGAHTILLQTGAAEVHSDDGASTVFSASGEDWDAPTLANASSRNSKASCEIKRSFCDAGLIVPCPSPSTLPGNPYVEVGSTGCEPKSDLARGSSRLGSGYPGKQTDATLAPKPRIEPRIQNGAKGSRRASSSFFRPNSNHNDKKGRGTSPVPAQRFSLLRIFSS